MGNEEGSGGGEIHYRDFVDYSALDPFARAAIDTFSKTLDNPVAANIRLVRESIGETAQVYEISGAGFYIAKNVEILGTKAAIAIEMSRTDPANRARYFSGIGQDTANMSLNDLVGVGARPFSYSPIISLGDNELLRDSVVVESLLGGYMKAANEAGAAIPGGETGTVRGIVSPGHADLSGGSLGLISPRERFCHGGRVQEGDTLYGVRTSSPHANGYSSIRRVADSLERGYFTEMPSGTIFGEAVLRPTPGYSGLVNGLMDTGIAINYLQPITGHGFIKIARPRRELTYRVASLPEIPEVFRFLQEKSAIDDREMLTTYNCGVGFVIYAPESSRLIPASRELGYDVFKMGVVEGGRREVVVEPLEVTIQP